MIFPAAALLLLSLSPARAHDMGQEVTFDGASIHEVLPRVASAHGAVLGPSDPLGPFEAVLLNGVVETGELRAAVSVRRGGSWSAWKPFTFHRYPNGRFWAKAETGPGEGPLRLRLDGSALAGGLTLYEMETSGLESERRGAAPPEGAARQQEQGFYFDRTAWGAKPPKEPYSADEPYRFTLHHTDGARPEKLEDSISEMRMLQDFHQNGRGWIDIGYHFVIDGAGRIFEGRPQTVVGAHTQRNNDGNLGISLMGDFNPGHRDSTTPNAAQLDAVERLGRFLSARYGIRSELLRGHRDYKSTDCPGDALYALLPSLRRRIARPQAPLKPKAVELFRRTGSDFVPVSLPFDVPPPPPAEP